VVFSALRQLGIRKSSIKTEERNLGIAGHLIMVAEQDRQKVATGYGKKPYLLTEQKTICTPLKNVFCGS
jgi:hypothetical protein